MSNSAFAPRLAVLPRDEVDVECLIIELITAAFKPGRDPRSKLYMNGVRAALYRRATGEDVKCPFRAGSVDFDAWYAGVDEGRAIWQRHIDTVVANCAAAGVSPRRTVAQG